MKDKAIIFMIITAIGGFISGFTIGSSQTRPVQFQYSALNDYYFECMSLHGGTDSVTIHQDGSYDLKCADGHMAKDPRHDTGFTTELVKGD